MMKKKAIKFSELNNYISEKENPKNEKNIKEVNIYYPSELLKKGVILIDTPGIGSIHQNNTETTEKYLKHADAVIFVLAVDPPMTEDEVNFLNKVEGIANKIIFVVNKIDLVAEDEKKEIIDFARKVITNKTKLDEISIFPLSAENILNSNDEKSSAFQKFSQKVEKLITEQKAQIIIDSVERKLNYIIEELLFKLKLEKKIMLEPLETLQEKIKIIDEKLEIIREKKKK